MTFDELEPILRAATPLRVSLVIGAIVAAFMLIWASIRSTRRKRS